MIQRMFVTIDTKKTNYKNVGKINHGDDLILELTVLSDGDMISFNNPMVDLLVKKSDGKMIRQNSGIKHIRPNKFIIEVSKDCVTSPGLSTNQLIINDNGRISTCMFYYTILSSLEEDIIESVSNVEVLEQLDEFTIQMKDKMENFDNELQNRMSKLKDDIDDLVESFGATSVELQEAELSRNEAEQTRAQAESVRVQNESIRLQNDLDLANAEAERVRAENVRIQNEADRALVDAVMDQKESEREDSELERIQNESKRATNEEVRQQNENTRQSNESIRMSNETDRKTQENRRVTAETNRVNAETTRRNNENSRISNEIERQKAMNEMNSLINDANGFYERVSVVENEIVEINSSLDNIENDVNVIKTYPVNIQEFKHLVVGGDWSYAIQYLIDHGYRNIYIPQGDYVIERPVEIVGGIKIYGDFGEGLTGKNKTVILPKTIAFTCSESISTQQSQDVTIENILFRGGSTIIDLPLFHLVRIRYCTFIDFSTNGIVLVRGERHEFKSITFWSQTKDFECAFAFADKTKTTHSAVQNMDFGVNKEWVDRVTMSDITTMHGSQNAYDYSLYIGNCLSNATIMNLYAHGGRKSVIRAGKLQESVFSNWVIDGWGSKNNPCEYILYFGQVLNSVFTGVSPGFAGNCHAIKQFYIQSVNGTTIQSCQATGNNETNYGFVIGQQAGNAITFISCRGSLYSESINKLHAGQITTVSCGFDYSNIGNNTFYKTNHDIIYTFMADANGATASEPNIIYRRASGGGGHRNMFCIQKDRIRLNHFGAEIISGVGSPEGVVTSNVGSLYLNTSPTNSDILYIKQSGSGNTGWVVK